MLKGMETRRGTADQRRAEAIAAGMRVFADHGLTTASIQQVADAIGVSQPYVFRLFGSKHAFFLACLDEFEGQVREVFREAAGASPGDPLPAMRAGFRELLANDALTGLWLQACATARSDEAVAERCRAVVSGVLQEAARLTDTAPESLGRALADGALVVMLQALGVDISGGSRAAIESLRAKETTS
ncbi:TetR/AcrR family transcriptional regulator [Nonomuraea jiangxiensis]|uniref:DNA-binding transcriptional regulator, AcrR family n=1 Tax=Nonomuraea jiangxiensis TaxID=633440 RepID=A0A1G8QKT4_9ACTN|nr:TetR/AcrR family transcriptional regulator [Nonomuraea jiangxiensis]SDJ05276.1 DNA-binding transcriptional regulator, AcrR family [Nonomuraea jiangxiensis]